MKSYFLSYLVVLSVCMSAQAQDRTLAQNTSSSEDKVVQQLLIRIDELEKRSADYERLEKRVAELESQAGNASKPAPTAAGAASTGSRGRDA